MSTPIRRSAKPPLRWRREPPDVPGWWWWRHDGHATIEYYDTDDCERFPAILDNRDYCWAGPIELPREVTHG